MNRHHPHTTVNKAALRAAIDRHLTYTVGKNPDAATPSDWRVALTCAIRDLVINPWFDTTLRVYAEDRKRVYYLSMEFLIGRLLGDAIANLGLEETARDVIRDLGFDIDEILHDEPDAALGNGGLGRLAACYLDSMSTIGVPAFGYGIRYEHGLFRQSFEDGWQVERAEEWLRQGHPWEFERREAVYRIGFGGEVCAGDGDAATWRPADSVLAKGFDTPIPGWRARWTNTLRLWSARPTRLFDLEPFNRGDFVGAAAPGILAETISRVLYPDDTTEQGKELRLKQEYFFTAASLQDLLRRFLSRHNDLADLPSAVAIQLNDTHPAIAVAELTRLLVDEHGLAFGEAFDITAQTLHYTNHTLLPEALERWPRDLMHRVLPRHMQIIERIDAWHGEAFPERGEAARIVDDHNVSMGALAFIGSRRVNGVSALHTDLMKKTVFRELDSLYPSRIVNVTNGVTQRRWLYGCNPGLRDLLNEAIGPGWVTNLEELARLRPLAEDAAFRARFAAVKRANKARLSNYFKDRVDLKIDPNALFDIQIKRIHEYKRQLLNVLQTAAAWNAIRRAPERDWTPRVKIFGGKAAPGYAQAKLIIKLINDIGATINADPAMHGRLQVIYPENYNVSMAEMLIPAADLSEQISTAGMEASGTGNMKLSMNGALTVGTLDGANVEIREAVGEENIFIFGLTADQVAELRTDGYDPAATIAASPELGEVLEQIETGVFSPNDPQRFKGIVDNLRQSDWFLVNADFDAYTRAQTVVDEAWRDVNAWTRMAAINVSGMGRFSSDRSARDYAREVWDVEPVY